jgi:hypothetical protein
LAVNFQKSKDLGVVCASYNVHQTLERSGLSPSAVIDELALHPGWHNAILEYADRALRRHRANKAKVTN